MTLSWGGVVSQLRGLYSPIGGVKILQGCLRIRNITHKTAYAGRRMGYISYS